MCNYFIRNKQLFGEGFNNYLINKKVLVVGLGGVGGSVFESLVRLGFNSVYIIDFDKFEESNLNRQVLSNLDNIGNLKIDGAIKFAKGINENIKVYSSINKIESKFINPFNECFDYVFDCIDFLEGKIAIYKYCLENNVQLISAMGMAKRIDSSKLLISKLSKTNYDPLAKKMRLLCKNNGIDSNKINVVYSLEEPAEGIELSSIMTVPNACGIMMVSKFIMDMKEKYNA